jgi:hypothetical protein
LNQAGYQILQKFEKSSRVLLGRGRRSKRSLLRLRVDTMAQASKACSASPDLSSLLLHPPELKAVRSNGLFDSSAGEIVGRSIRRADSPDSVPWPKLIWKFAPRRVCGKSPEPAARI